MAQPRQLLDLLADGQFRSGEALGRGLGLSRAAVWKLVGRARALYGVRISAVPGKGYRLERPLELLEPATILGRLSRDCRAALANVFVHDQVTSTNTWLMQQAGTGLASGTACLAEQQTAGRGRRGRTWVSPFGQNLYLSLLWRFPCPPADLGGLSLAAGVGVALALGELGAEGIGLKWPNDLLWNRKKLGGLLIEVMGESQGPTAVVCGVGVNTHLSADDARPIDQPWTDLSAVLAGRQWARNEIAAGVLERLVWVMQGYERGGLAPFLPHWRRLDPFLGQPIELRLADTLIHGTHAGIDDTGALRLAHDQGVDQFVAGEVSLRALG